MKELRPGPSRKASAGSGGGPRTGVPREGLRPLSCSLPTRGEALTPGVEPLADGCWERTHLKMSNDCGSLPHGPQGFSHPPVEELILTLRTPRQLPWPGPVLSSDVPPSSVLSHARSPVDGFLDSGFLHPVHIPPLPFGKNLSHSTASPRDT